MLLKGEDEIIRNRSRINLGIYTAKKQEGRYLGSAPYGYKNARDDSNKPIIIPDEENVHIIKYIFWAFLDNIPYKEILSKINSMGFKKTGHSTIRNILQNPTYIGLLKLKAYKDYLEEMVEAKHQPLIDKPTWYDVQRKLKGPQTIQILTRRCH